MSSAKNIQQLCARALSELPSLRSLALLRLAGAMGHLRVVAW
jgi:hypothetical protein